jgi:hypothetical protein
MNEGMCTAGQRAAAGMGVARDWRTRMKERQRFWSVSHGFKACLCLQAETRRRLSRTF